MAAKKISAVITAPNSEPYRAYFQPDGDFVWVWTENISDGGMRLSSGVDQSRYNGGVFSRDWVRACYLPDVTVEF